MNAFVVQEEKSYLSFQDFKTRYDHLREEGIKSGSGKKLQDNIDARATLVNEISLNDPNRIPKIRYVLGKTKRPKILRAALDKLNYLEPKEVIAAYELLSPKSSNSKDKNEEIEEAKTTLIKKMIHANKNIIQSSTSPCEHLGVFQALLVYVLGMNMPDEIFQMVITERIFPNLETFRTFYTQLLGNKLCSSDQAENRRRFIVQKYLPSLTNEDFKIKALSSAFVFENSRLMLLRIIKIADREKITLALPDPCFNLDAIENLVFTKGENACIDREMEEIESEQKKSEENILSIQAQTELDLITSGKACNSSILLEDPEEQADFLEFFKNFHPKKSGFTK